MRHVSLGRLEVSRIAESIRTIHRALDLGITFIDTAEVYGPYTNEALVGGASGRAPSAGGGPLRGHVQDQPVGSHEG